MRITMATHDFEVSEVITFPYEKTLIKLSNMQALLSGNLLALAATETLSMKPFTLIWAGTVANKCSSDLLVNDDYFRFTL